MAAGLDVYDTIDYRNSDAADDAAMRYGLDVQGTPTASVHRRGLQLMRGGTPGMTKSNLRTIAYFAIVGGVVVWMVAHLAPIRG